MLNKITNRLILGFSIPILFLIVLGAILYSSTAHLIKVQEDSRRLSNVYEDTNEFAYNIAKIIGTTRGYALYPKMEIYSKQLRKAMMVAKLDSC